MCLTYEEVAPVYPGDYGELGFTRFERKDQTEWGLSEIRWSVLEMLILGPIHHRNVCALSTTTLTKTLKDFLLTSNAQSVHVQQ